MSIQSAHRSNDENTRPHSGAASSREADLGRAPIGSLLFKLALPAIAAQIINVLYNMVDRMYIGHIPDIGPSALTGVGVTMPIIMCISAFAALAAMGGAPQASILMGKGDKDSAEKVLGNCTFMLTVISLLLTALFLGFGRPILLMFGASEKTILYAWNYMKIYVCGTFFVQMALGLNAFINAQGYAKTGMITVAIGALCNIILDPIFIFGLHLDVRGAALATILSQGISCIWILRFLTGTHSTLRIRLRNLRPQKKFILPCLALGLAPFIMQTPKSIPSRSELERLIPQIRAQGYACDDEESETGLTCYAAPVVSMGQAIAAISISGPSTRMELNRDRYVALVKDAALKIGKKLGY